MQAVHAPLHKVKLCRSGTVAGIIRSGEAIQIVGVLRESIIQRELGEMEPSNQHIGMEPADDIADSSMGAATE